MATIRPRIRDETEIMTNLQNRIFTICLLTIALLASHHLRVACGEDEYAAAWPTHQGNLQRNAWTRESLPIDQLTSVWRWRSALSPEPAWHGPAKWDAYAGIRGLHSMRNYDPAFHPVASQDHVWFASSSDDSVRCVDLDSGQVLWRFTADAPIRVAPSLAGERLYFGADDGWAYCVDAKGGELIWKHSPAPKATKLVHNGRLISPWPVRSGVSVFQGVAYYAASLLPWQPSYLVAVNAENGKQESPQHYQHEIKQATFEGPLVVSPKRLIAPQGRVAPLLFDRASGKGQGSLKGGGGSFVVLTPDSQVVHGPGNKTGWLTSSRPVTREAIATFKQGNAIVVAGDVSFMLTDDELVVSDWVNRKPRWRSPCGEAFSLLVAGDSVYVGLLDAIAVYDAATGKEQRRLKSEGRVYGLAVADGRLIASTDDGVVQTFASPAGRVVKTEPKTNRETDKPTKAAIRSKTRLPIQPLDDPQLVGRWVFQRPHADTRIAKDLAGSSPAAIRTASHFINASGHEAIELDGKGTIVVQDDFRRANLPKRSMTVEAWARVDQAMTWGGLVGAIQDNGSYERGWLLGFRDSRFCFAVASDKKTPKLTYLTEPTDRKLGQWRHIAGVYDGQVMSLYVDGQLVASSKDQQGDILYPPNAVFEIGAYHDDNEYYRLKGAIHEIRLFNRALAADEIARHAQSKKLLNPPQARVDFGPYLRFITPTEAVVQWRTEEACATVLLVDGERIVESESKQREHAATIGGLRKKQLRTFQIEFEKNGERALSQHYECDNFFNFADRPLSKPPQAPSSKLGLDIMQRAPKTRGMGLLLNPPDQIVLDLARHPRMRWIAFVSDLEQQQRLRATLLELGAYGRTTVLLNIKAADGATTLPITSAFADMAVSFGEVSSDANGDVIDEHRRCVRPGGIHFRVADENATLADPWRRERLEGAGSWTHLYGAADNSAFGGESLAGVTRSEQLAVQWIGRPGARYQPDRSGRKPSPLAVNGRLFLQGLERLIALNSFNGSVLWSLETPHLGRFNMPRDCSNWCADSSHLYVAMGGDLWVIDGASGQLSHVLNAAELSGLDSTGDASVSTKLKYEWGFVGQASGLVIGSAVKPKTVYTEYWGNAEQGWYDARSGSSTYKVCSDSLFAYSVGGKKRTWKHDGVVVNSTITLTKDRIFFAESRNSKVIASPERRVGQELNTELFFVCLDLQTGKKIWDRQIEGFDGEVALFASHANGTIVVVGSAKNRYDVRVMNSADGKPIWKKQTPWPRNHHGGHMSRPAIVGNALYVRPQAFELRTGLGLSVKMPAGGCGTYAATTETLLFRSRNVTMWDRRQGESTAWTRLRPDCWLSTIPADGLLLSPEGGGGCSCGSWMETSLGFIPRKLLAPPND